MSIRTSPKVSRLIYLERSKHAVSLMNAVTDVVGNALLDALLFLQMFVDARAKFISRWC